MRKKTRFFTVFSVIFITGLTVFGGCADESAQNQETIQAIEGLKKQVKALQDLEEIKQLHIRYVNDLTFGEWDDLVSLFTQDAVLAVFMGREPYRGIDAIRDVFMNEISKSDKHVGREANMTIHPLISVEGDKAKGNWMIYFITQPNPESEAIQVLQGIYDVEYAKENGEWKISYIKWVTRFAIGSAGNPPGK